MPIRRKIATAELSPKEKLQAAFADLRTAKEAASEARNAENRAKTAIKKELLAYLKSVDAPATSHVIDNGVEAWYGATQSEEFPLDAWFKLYKEKQITEDQFKSALSVSITEARKQAGADVVLSHTTTKLGTKADIRMDKCEEAAFATGFHLVDGATRKPIVLGKKRNNALAPFKAPVHTSGAPKRIVRRVLTR